mgnify:FL=1
MLNRIQTLLQGHKYRLFYSLRAVFGCPCKFRIYFEKDLREASDNCDLTGSWSVSLYKSGFCVKCRIEAGFCPNTSISALAFS